MEGWLADVDSDIWILEVSQRAMIVSTMVPCGMRAFRSCSLIRHKAYVRNVDNVDSRLETRCGTCPHTGPGKIFSECSAPICAVRRAPGLTTSHETVVSGLMKFGMQCMISRP